MATDEYGKLFKRAWGDPDFKALTVSQQALYQKLISQPDISLAGVVTLATTRWAGQTADLTPAAIDATLDGLAARRFVVVDRDTQEVLVRAFIRRDLGWKSLKTIKGIVLAVERVLSPTILGVISAELERIDTTVLSDRRSDQYGTSPREYIEAQIAHLVDENPPRDTPSDGVSTVRSNTPDTPCQGVSEGVSDTPPEGVSDGVCGDSPLAIATATAPTNATATAVAGGCGGNASTDLALVVDATASADAPASPTPKTRRGSRLHDGWTPARSDANLNAEQPFDSTWLTDQLDRFRDYWAGVTGTKGTKLDWDATWRNWIRRSGDQRRRNNRGPDWDALMAHATSDDQARGLA